MVSPSEALPKDRLADFCRRWKITELSLFGSALRDDFRRQSILRSARPLYAA